MKRKPPNKTEKLAAALLMLKRGEDWLIPEPIRSTGDAKAICACVEWDHATPHALTADNRPQNLTPMRPADHLTKTLKDVPRLAKGKRLARSHAEHLTAMSAKIGQADPPLPARKRPRAVIPGSRASPFKRKLNGRVERRT